MADRIPAKERISKHVNLCYLSVLFHSWRPFFNIFLGFSICDGTLNLEKKGSNIREVEIHAPSTTSCLVNSWVVSIIVYF